MKKYAAFIIEATKEEKTAGNIRNFFKRVVEEEVTHINGNIVCIVNNICIPVYCGDTEMDLLARYQETKSF